MASSCSPSPDRSAKSAQRRLQAEETTPQTYVQETSSNTARLAMRCAMILPLHRPLQADRWSFCPLTSNPVMSITHLWLGAVAQKGALHHLALTVKGAADKARYLQQDCQFVIRLNPSTIRALSAQLIFSPGSRRAIFKYPASARNRLCSSRRANVDSIVTVTAGQRFTLLAGQHLKLQLRAVDTALGSEAVDAMQPEVTPRCESSPRTPTSAVPLALLRRHRPNNP